MFKSIEEFAHAMLDGRVFEFRNCNYYWNKKECKFWIKKKQGIDKGAQIWPHSFKNYNKVKEVHWHNNIPLQGVLCCVWHGKDFDEKLIVVIKKYRIIDYLYEDDRGCLWDNAFPLTFKEISQYILQDQQP
jgi:hypothetical protein